MAAWLEGESGETDRDQMMKSLGNHVTEFLYFILGQLEAIDHCQSSSDMSRFQL